VSKAAVSCRTVRLLTKGTPAGGEQSEAGWYSGRAAHQIRTHYQPEDRQIGRSDHPTDSARTRRPVDRQLMQRMRTFDPQHMSASDPKRTWPRILLDPAFTEVSYRTIKPLQSSQSRRRSCAFHQRAWGLHPAACEDRPWPSSCPRF